MSTLPPCGNAGARAAEQAARQQLELAEEAVHAAAVLLADTLVDHPDDTSLHSWHRLNYQRARTLARIMADEHEDAYELWAATRLAPVQATAG